MGRGHNNLVALSKKLDDIGIDDPQNVRYKIALRERDHGTWIWLLTESIYNMTDFTG
ncbi:MAG: hypothetical protein ACOZCL_09010 [Bacillota bacterium]